jgi:trk system potassium uptake protein TrkA
MHVIILGCGRVGSTLALMLDCEKHAVSVIDKDGDAFRRLGENFCGRTVAGWGIDADTLLEAGIEGADAFVAVTNGDNTNIMASQIAKTLFGVPHVLARIYDPLRAHVYREFDIETICSTTLSTGLLFDRLFERPFQPVADYLKLTKQIHHLYAADLPIPEQAATRRTSSEGKRPGYIIVTGGGKVGYHLTRALLHEKYEVLLVEKRSQQYLALREELGDSIFRGDACEIRTMVRMGMERADLVVAVTGDDEDNLVICQVAKRWFGVPRVIARVNTPHNEEIFRTLGVDETINATTLLFRLIEQEVATKELVHLSLLRKGNLEVVEVDLSAKSPVVGKTVREMNLPPGCLLVAVVRGKQAQIVTGETILQQSDVVVAMAEPAAVSGLRQALLG